MKFTFRLYLVEDKKTKEGYPIVIVAQDIKRFTSIKTNKSYWDKKNQRVNSMHPKHVEMNADLAVIKTEYEEAFRELKTTMPTMNEVHLLVEHKRLVAAGKTDQPFKIAKATPEILDELDENAPLPNNLNKLFIRYKMAFKKLVSSEYLRGFDQVQKALYDFKPKALATDVTPNFWFEYKEYLVEELELVDGTIAQHLKKLRTIIEYYRDDGNKINNEFIKVKQSENTPERFALSKEQVFKIFYLEIENDYYLELARVIFLMQCASGLRVKELLRLHPEEVKLLDFIIYYQHKSKKSNRVPTNFISRFFIKRYLALNPTTTLFPPITGQTLNEKIKIIGQMAGLNDILVYRNWSGNNLIEFKKPMWALLTTHIARHTFGSRINKVSNNSGSLTRKALGKASKGEDVYIHLDDEQYEIMRTVYD